ncbi:hypothetical protein ACHAW5_000415 [Stephanodiscus triporus]|uniref:Uncharacterized protein n=1 Tax=Stephanodiscus triporus TaxID=2934178 RepID=A0ABD3MIU4_9STRA
MSSFPPPAISSPDAAAAAATANDAGGGGGGDHSLANDDDDENDDHYYHRRPRTREGEDGMRRSREDGSGGDVSFASEGRRVGRGGEERGDREDDDDDDAGVNGRDEDDGSSREDGRRRDEIRHAARRRRTRTTPLSQDSVSTAGSQSTTTTVARQHHSGGTPAVAIGGHGSRGGGGGNNNNNNNNNVTVQDVGNFRMLIDDLSYLSSAIVQCRNRTTTRDDDSDNINESIIATVDHRRHTAITAGAACGMAELVSQSDARTKIMSIYAKNYKIGAIEAILESIACAPNAKSAEDGDSPFVVCRELIDGRGLTRATTTTTTTTTDIRDGRGRSSSAIYPSAGGSKGKEAYYDAVASKALAVVSYFVGSGCIEPDRSTIPSRGSSNRLAAQWARESVLRHKPALRGIARLVADDPVVRAYLHGESIICADRRRCLDGSLAGDDVPGKSGSRRIIPSSLSSKFPAPLHNGEPSLSAHRDPTKNGRISRKRKNPQKDDNQFSFTFGESPENGSLSSFNLDESPDQSLDPMPSLGTARSNHEKSNHTPQTVHRNGEFEGEFKVGCASPVESQYTEANGIDKFEEKISLAMSRTTLTRENDCGLPSSQRDVPSKCALCGVWAPLLISHLGPGKEKFSPISSSSLALVALNYIISGREKCSSELDYEVLRDENDNEFAFLSDSHCQLSPLSENPIVFANEMLRHSGALPYLSRSMSETLAAILLSNNGKNCPACITYLQDRACSLSEAIDSLCCLSPNVSITLSLRESLLVPSLLRSVAELSFGVEDDLSPLYFESTTTALKTLTSLTHENSVACDQMINSYSWKIPLPTLSRDGMSSCQLTGLDIIFSCLFKTASLKQTRGAHQQKMDYDNAIFCLNILTNIVEMAAGITKSMIENIVVEERCSSAEGSVRTSGLSWLTRWVVSKTLGFQDSVMKGSFGSKTGSTDDNELESGEEENLVTSGNGFVLLAYLIVDDGSSSGRTSKSIRDTILKELPIDNTGNSGGIYFIIKALKAFCNFYHYSVGDLSVAVIAPVIKLISGLEKMDFCGPELQE